MENKASQRAELDRHDALDAELLRLEILLRATLGKLGRRGRTPLHEATEGAVIEDAEVAGLLVELANERRSAHVHAEPIAAPIELPALTHAAQRYGLDRFERDVLLLCLAVEIDGRYGRIVAFLNDHAQRSRPTVELLLTMFAGEGERRERVASFFESSPLLRRRLVELEGDVPLASRAVRMSGDWWPRLIGLDAADAGITSAVPLDALDVSPETTAQVSRVLALLERETTAPIVIITGPRGCGRDAIAGAIAHARCWQLLRVPSAHVEHELRLRDHARDAAWYGAALVVEAATSLGASTLQTLARLDVPIFVITTTGCREHLAGAVTGQRPVLEVRVEALDVERSSRLWDRLLPERHRDGTIDFVAHASRYRFNPARIELSVALARSRSDSDRVGPGLLAEVCRALPDVQISELAVKLPCPFTREDLVLRADTRRELDLVRAWSRHGAEAVQRWGLGRTYGGRGLACLFSGPPGTGKTLAAQVLAAEIGIDLYRIDLAHVVSKYIGETEKNLAKLFDEAQQSSAILFFDEADALFTTRTEIKDSHDRYANLETGFLLQKLESHPGICILATNLKRNLDEAFVRRLQVIAEFPIPDAPERLQIWRKHLPAAEHLAGDIDVQRLANQFTITGGEIRNTVLTATLLAADAGERIAMQHVVQALWRELIKTGRVVELASFGEWKHHVVAYSRSNHR